MSVDVYLTQRDYGRDTDPFIPFLIKPWSAEYADFKCIL